MSLKVLQRENITLVLQQILQGGSNNHNSDKVYSTRKRGPWKLVYSEIFSSRSKAVKREFQLKSFKGGNALKKLLDSYSGIV